MCEKTTLRGTTNATSLPESADGASRYDSQDGQQTDLFGQAPVPASPSVRRVRKRSKTIPVICGRYGSGSSASAALQSSLENRLRARLPAAGSMNQAMTWKRKATPSGRRYCQLVVSVPHIKEIGCLWFLTPRAQESGERPETFVKRMGDRGAHCHSSLKAQLGGNPSQPFLAWIMGIPIGKITNDCTEIVSSRKSRRNL